MMQSTCFDADNAPVTNSEVSSGKASGSSLYSYVISGSDYLRETIADIGSYQGITQLDCEIEARMGNLHHDAVSLVSNTFKWATKGIPKLAKKTVKKTASVADYYFFSSS